MAGSGNKEQLKSVPAEDEPENRTGDGPVFDQIGGPGSCTTLTGEPTLVGAN